MKIYLRSWLGVMALVIVFSLNMLAADDPVDVPLRMANGAVIAGVLKEATLDGLVIQGEKGPHTVPWKYLSAGTRYRYEAQAVASKKGAAATKATRTKTGRVGATKRPAK